MMFDKSKFLIITSGFWLDWLEWRPEEKNRFLVFEKSSGKVFKTEFLSAKAFYYMHFANCYEESNQLVLDIVTYDSPNVLDTMMIKNLRSNTTNPNIDLPYFQRFVLPIIPDLKVANVREDLNLITGMDTTCTAIRSGNKIIVSGEVMSGCGMDLPMINKRFLGRKARYVYATSTLHDHEYSNSVCKVDLETKTCLKWKFDDFKSPGEPYFIADPKGSKEDDGVVMFAVTDRRVGESDYVVVLDAATWKEVARAKFESHVPSSLHGIFLQN